MRYDLLSYFIYSDDALNCHSRYLQRDARALVVSLLELALRDVALDLDVDLLRSHSVRVGL